jgi:membrane-bound lytic murein transglycosylase D
MGKEFVFGAILLLAAAIVPRTSAQPPAEPAAAASQSSFPALHAELEQAADSILADAVQRTAEATRDGLGRTPEASSTALQPAFRQQYRSGQNHSFHAAMDRLVRLRPLIQPILGSEGVPLGLTSVALVESGGRTDILSRKGALGLWQLMPDTARQYGLIVNAAQDQRLDPEKSTYAAARYLSDLYAQFGSWPLALAAYNAGEGSVKRAITRGASRNFLELSALRLFPQETRDYVPAVLAVMQMFAGESSAAYMGELSLSGKQLPGTLLIARGQPGD